MAPRSQIDLSNISDESIVFWSGGNSPTQRTYNLSTSHVFLHMKALHLLSERILAAASFYFESHITREVTTRLLPLFERGDILYFVDSTIENFTEHGVQKIVKSPRSLIAYRDKGLVNQRAQKLDSLGYILRRPPCSLSDRIVDLWIKDIYSNKAATVGNCLFRLAKNEDERLLFVNRLINIAVSRNKDFVWEYLRPKLIQLDFPKTFLHFARRRLSQMYAFATSEILGASIDSPEHLLSSSVITERSRFDTALFLNCMDVLQVTKFLNDLSPLDLIKLKNSEEFIFFREFYFALIETADYQRSEIDRMLPIYRKMALHYPKVVTTAEQFLRIFKLWCQSVGKPGQKYARPLEQLLHIYDLLHHLSIEEFISRLVSLSQKEYSEEDGTFVGKQVLDSQPNLQFLERPKMNKILFLAANPSDTQPLKLDVEIREIDGKILRSEFRDLFKIEQQWAVRVTDIQEHLLRYKPDIVHFSGHGSKTSELILLDNFGKSQAVTVGALSQLFSTLRGNIRCVVLNLCYSESQARAIVKHIDCVIGMNKAIGDSAAISFASAFYRVFRIWEGCKNCI